MSTGTAWGMMLFMGLGGLVFLAAIGSAIYLLARRLRQDDALMVLRRRFAEGEITAEQYHERLAMLRRSGG